MKGPLKFESFESFESCHFPLSFQKAPPKNAPDNDGRGNHWHLCDMFNGDLTRFRDVKEGKKVSR